MTLIENDMEQNLGSPEAEIEDPEEGEENPLEEPKLEGEEIKEPASKQDTVARKTFITDKGAKVEAGEYKPPFSLHDLLIPGGKPAKLAKVPDISVPDLRLPEILFRFKFRDPKPVILLIGGFGTRA